MAGNRSDSSSAPAASGENQAGSTESAAPAPQPSGGAKAWLPLILSLVLMPAVAYAMTVFVLLPRVTGGSASAPPEEPAKHGDEHGKEPAASKSGSTAPIAKVLVNVAGTMGTRYLMVNMTLVGKSPAFTSAVEKNEAQLRDAASSTLATKTISDLEKPGARNLIRSELISAFNNILGQGSTTDIYLTDFAIQ